MPFEYWFQILAPNGAITRSRPRPLSQTESSLMLVAETTDGGATDRFLLTPFAVAGYFGDNRERLAYQFTGANNGEIWHQTDNNAYYRVEAGVLVPFVLVPPVGATGGGGDPDPDPANDTGLRVSILLDESIAEITSATATMTTPGGDLYNLTLSALNAQSTHRFIYLGETLPGGAGVYTVEVSMTNTYPDPDGVGTAVGGSNVWTMSRTVELVEGAIVEAGATLYDEIATGGAINGFQQFTGFIVPPAPNVLLRVYGFEGVGAVVQWGDNSQGEPRVIFGTETRFMVGRNLTPDEASAGAARVWELLGDSYPNGLTPPIIAEVRVPYREGSAGSGSSLPYAAVGDATFTDPTQPLILQFTVNADGTNTKEGGW